MIPAEPIDQAAALAYASNVLRTISGDGSTEDNKAALRAARMLDAIREDMD